MRLLYSIAFILALAWSQALAAPPAAKTSNNQGVFTSVNGKVQIKKKGKKARVAKNGSTIRSGEKVTADKNANAVLRFFDGSELKVSPKTEFTISQLKQEGLQDKVMKFQLAFGELWASVKKLTSSKSSFEIESGGVVCGVRGTKYSYHFDPETKKVTVHVEEGTVYINSDGHTYIFTAGQTGVFDNGKPGKTDDSDHSNDHGDKGKGGNDGTSGLADLNQQFGDGLAVNGDNNFTDPAVGGSVKINVHANVAPGETVP